MGRVLLFQSALPLRGATQFGVCLGNMFVISIRAPLAGSDHARLVAPGSGSISIRAPLAGSDPIFDEGYREKLFQSALPLRGATTLSPASCRRLHFNPRSPCGERHAEHFQSRAQCDISIRAPLAGSDRVQLDSMRLCFISIRAPLAGSDTFIRSRHGMDKNFNPRSPCGERPLG